MANRRRCQLGAIVLLSDERTMRAASGPDTLAALRQAAHPGSHHRVRPRASGPRREITDPCCPARALRNPRLTATVTFSSFGFSGSRARLSVRDNGKVLASRRDARFPTAGCGPNRWCSIVATRDRRLSRSASTAARAKENMRTRNHSPGQPWRRASRDSYYVEGRRAGLQIHPPRAAFLPNDDHPEQEIASMLRQRRIRVYRQGTPVPGTGRRIPRQSRELFAYQGLIIGSVELNIPPGSNNSSMTCGSRGGGLLLLGGRRRAFPDGGWASGPLPV